MFLVVTFMMACKEHPCKRPKVHTTVKEVLNKIVVQQETVFDGFVTCFRVSFFPI